MAGLGNLVLGRNRGKSVFITVPPSSTPTEIEVVVDDVDDNQAKLRFVAPKSTHIVREEIKGTLP